eukprot:456159-Amphidinium_carterae.1
MNSAQACKHETSNPTGTINWYLSAGAGGRTGRIVLSLLGDTVGHQVTAQSSVRWCGKMPAHPGAALATP